MKHGFWAWLRDLRAAGRHVVEMWSTDRGYALRDLRREARQATNYFLAGLVPPRVRYWIVIRAGVAASTGAYGDQEVPALPFMTALERATATGELCEPAAI